MNNSEQKKAADLGLIQEKTSGKLRWIIIAVVLLIIVVGGWLLLQPEDPAAGQIYKTDTVTRTSLAVTVTATGTVEPKDEVEVSSELSGIMDEVYVDYNDQIKKGQALAKLDTTTLEATVFERASSLKSAKANVTQSEADLEEAQLDYQHYQTVYKLSGGKHPSQQTMDSARIAVTKAKASLEVAKANVDMAQADLDTARTDLVKATLVSPIDGIVLSKDVEPGQTIASNYSAPTLFLLARDLKSMELHVDIDEADIAQIKQGQKATVTVDAWGGRQFDAEIAQIRLASTDDDSTSTVVSYETILDVDNEDLALLPGMTAVTDIKVKSAENVLTVSSAALRYTPASETTAEEQPGADKKSGGGMLFFPGPRRDNRKKGMGDFSGSVENKEFTIWVLRNNQPQPVTIKTGMTDGLRSEIAESDLQEGDEIIVDAVQVQK
ncbi:MAG: efflux transporter periplasmic adaptor subunit [Oceanospirillaceae bacterium]|nr:efflux transporter periplasmic adaptor subunit [Oceanospirillaceae bacterium]MBT12151.1 efflux transporter periplasmic adaptor subunit [Oceanospirillaceae bacterium]